MRPKQVEVDARHSYFTWLYFEARCSRSSKYIPTCSPANRRPWSHKSPAAVAELPKAKHISGVLADSYPNFSDDIPDRTDRLDPTQLSNDYSLE